MQYCYRISGQDFNFPFPVVTFEPFNISCANCETVIEAASFIGLSSRKNGSGIPDRQATGWVGGTEHLVELYDTIEGRLMQFEGGNGFLVTPNGETIVKIGAQEELTPFDCEVIAGPALVLALALRSVWSLHASAAMYKENLIAFLGESGQGKSTLTAYLSQHAVWRLVADDILPVTGELFSLLTWPRFPQLKLPVDSQPGPHLPEQLPLGIICFLSPTYKDAIPALQLLPVSEAVKVLLAHTAGTRLFAPEMLTKHLEFCARSAEQVPVYQLTYPHHRWALPIIKKMLENLC
jgi:hypothetical protein